VETPQLTPAAPLPTADSPAFRELISDAMRYWEPRRIGYNLALAAVVLGWVALTWPHFRSAFAWPSALAVLVLAVLANVCYCAAYVVDVTVQYSVLRHRWRRRRWVLWAIGVVFAGAVTFYWIADEIYPSVA